MSATDRLRQHSFGFYYSLSNEQALVITANPGVFIFGPFLADR
jgi:hypothetical protein